MCTNNYRNTYWSIVLVHNRRRNNKHFGSICSEDILYFYLVQFPKVRNILITLLVATFILSLLEWGCRREDMCIEVFDMVLMYPSLKCKVMPLLLISSPLKHTHPLPCSSFSLQLPNTSLPLPLFSTFLMYILIHSLPYIEPNLFDSEKWT